MYVCDIVVSEKSLKHCAMVYSEAYMQWLYFLRRDGRSRNKGLVKPEQTLTGGGNRSGGSGKWSVRENSLPVRHHRYTFEHATGLQQLQDVRWPTRVCNHEPWTSADSRPGYFFKQGSPILLQVQQASSSRVVYKTIMLKWRVDETVP
jgi:hypothetical protein